MKDNEDGTQENSVTFEELLLSNFMDISKSDKHADNSDIHQAKIY